jgi:hypothetical protein
MPRYARGYVDDYGYNSGSGSGGRSSSSDDEEEEIWENSFDKLYNLLRKINEEIRQRERLERRYEKLLENIDVSAEKIIDISLQELS